MSMTTASAGAERFQRAPSESVKALRVTARSIAQLSLALRARARHPGNGMGLGTYKSHSDHWGYNFKPVLIR